MLPSHRRRPRPWFSTSAPHRAHQSHPVHGEACHSLPHLWGSATRACLGATAPSGDPALCSHPCDFISLLEKGAPARSTSPSGFPFSLAILIYPTSVSHARSLSQQRQCGTASPRRHKWQSPSHRVHAPHRWCCGPPSAAGPGRPPAPTQLGAPCSLLATGCSFQTAGLAHLVRSPNSRAFNVTIIAIEFHLTAYY